MQVSFANAQSIAIGAPAADMERIENIDPLYVTTESLSQDYPLFASSLLNLVQNSEARIAYPAQPKR
jgi:hypothetical protein